MDNPAVAEDLEDLYEDDSGDLEEGEFKAPRLNELPSKKEVAKAAAGRVDSVSYTLNWAASGVKITQLVRVKIILSTDPENFRKRNRLLVATIEIIKIR